LGKNSFKPTTASLKRLLLLKTSRTRKSTVAQRDTLQAEVSWSPDRDGPDSQNQKQSLCSCLAAVLRPTVMNKQKQNNGQRNPYLKKVYSKSRTFILKCNSKIVGRSTRVKSAEHGKIFKNLSQI